MRNLEPHSDIPGYNSGLVCRHVCGGHIVLIDRYRAGSAGGPGGRWLLRHEPSGRECLHTEHQAAWDDMKLAASGELERHALLPGGSPRAVQPVADVPAKTPGRRPLAEQTAGSRSYADCVAQAERAVAVLGRPPFLDSELFRVQLRRCVETLARLYARRGAGQ